jgi:mono/diheme cytochrome c family protein
MSSVRATLGSWVLAVGVSLQVAMAAVGPAVTPDAPTFERDIRPILKAQCFQCHGEAGKAKGGIDLRLRRLMLKGDEGPAIVPGKASESRLIRLVRSGEMPKDGKPLSPAQVQVLERWINLGAPTARPEPEQAPDFVITEEERAFWAFQPVATHTPPAVRDASRVRTPVDRFILARLEAEGLAFAPDASPASLVRRLAFDLTGLPPEPEDVEAFASHPSDDAYTRLVERYLASPAYGERWGRHWLDVAGYADSNGGVEADSERPWAWRFRDYVIRSLNSDKPLDAFVAEQLSGDERVGGKEGDLSPEDIERLTATGFLRMAPDPTGDGPADPLLARNQVVADTLQVVSSSLLGLTVQCAQCHDHRYDPIPQSDFYRLRAVFEPAFDPERWKAPGQRLVSLMPSADRRRAAEIESAAAAIDKEAQKLHDELIETFVQKQLLLVPEARREAVIAARKTPADKRTDAHKALLREFPTFQDHIILGEVDREGANKVQEVRNRAAAERSKKPSEPMVHALVEEPGRDVPTALFHRGDPTQPRAKVTPGLLAVMGLAGLPESIPATNAHQRTTGRRSEFARRLFHLANPLTPRVLANRVWMHHFGVGIVATPADFGMLGERPTHPELLDFLAQALRSGGWKLKDFHRLLVTSTVYRQSSLNPEAQRADPDNRLLGRARLRRLDAESLRDALLALSGRINPEPFGPPGPVAVDPQGRVVAGKQRRDGNGDAVGVEGAQGLEFRRSIYLQVRRSTPVGMLEVFDAPVVNPNCEARPATTVPPQSLALMNDTFVLERARDLAARVAREAGDHAEARVERLWRLLHGTSPTPQERDRALAFTSRQATLLAEPGRLPNAPGKPGEPPAPTSSEAAFASLCHALLGSNRFLYLD